jgi:hypothetical protein
LRSLERPILVDPLLKPPPESSRTVLAHSQAPAFYDRFGKRQDSQAFFEDAALDELISHGAFERAECVFVLGCDTGRFAARLLTSHRSPCASYLVVKTASHTVGTIMDYEGIAAISAFLEAQGTRVTFDQMLQRAMKSGTTLRIRPLRKTLANPHWPSGNEFATSSVATMNSTGSSPWGIEGSSLGAGDCSAR